MVDSVYRTRSLGIGASGIPDQYADGKAAKVWAIYIGGYSKRTDAYKEFLINHLRANNVRHVLDVACGTGVDSIMLLENGFQVSSIDASDRMLKYALKERWERRKEETFDNWDIEEGNWLSLHEDCEIKRPEGGFDALVCLGNSFAHLPDFDGTLDNQATAISNFHKMLKPGGVLVIDHRNYDFILDTGKAPQKNIYYKGDRIVDIKTSVLHVNSEPRMITLDYIIDATPPRKTDESQLNGDVDEPLAKMSKMEQEDKRELSKFRLSYCPLRLEVFNGILKKVFGEDASHTVLGDYQPLGEVQDPAYYVHIIKSKE